MNIEELKVQNFNIIPTQIYTLTENNMMHLIIFNYVKQKN